MKHSKSKWQLFLAIMGPGIITAFADNDAGGIVTYAAAGAKYGYALLSVLLVSTLCLAVVQEISARTGAVTGQGLSDLIREQYGVRWTFFAMAVLLLANIGTTVSEFSGIATSFEILGVNKYVSVPLAACAIWWLVLKTSYEKMEKIFLLLCLTFFSYVFSGFLASPDWQQAARAIVQPEFRLDIDFLLVAVGIIGTTVTPWGQFYIQASVVDKGITAKEYRYTFWDVMIGSFFTGFIALFILVATAATLYVHQVPIESAKDVAWALEPLAGPYAMLLFAGGLLGASMLAAFILPLSTAYAVCEALGFEHRISSSYKEAPVFFGLYTLLIAAGAGIVLWPDVSLYMMMLASQVINGILLPPILIFIILIARDKGIMGRYVNSGLYNVICWLLVLVLILLSVLLLAGTLFPAMLS
ncbi:Nramp family divalent metal transporter [Propionispora vibrioides]|uniref:NRAMP (Natural resistance-associated macrophage protein) metal ion transporters n=1 Tax=Propionispora vibrioides TaxID=112903 RepID=A0A1H8Y1X2_9FIRM|nr:Nramp family divalent metal transporter [Propionispora vibrioides]SEP46001.1 NRAMP (natural resistance-associated macrophage protein) metal ion transporters [Propionispora vibrioides]